MLYVDSRGRYISKLDERLQNVESAIRDYLPQAAHRIGRPEAVDPSAYDLSYPEDGSHQPSESNQDGPLAFLGNGEGSQFWSSSTPKQVTTLPDLSAVKAVVSSDVTDDAMSA